MSTLSARYRPSLSLLTDLYQLTMAYGYWKTGRAQDQAVFHLFFRRSPFDGGFAIAAGLADAIDLLENLGMDAGDLDYLSTLTGNDGKPLFEPDFLAFLGGVRLECDVEAIPEGTAVFPHEPLLRISGPLLQCQIVESPLLNLLNFQTLIATKAARICMAAQGDPVLEFGLRRAQGVDGSLSASRAAYIGGCVATSNVLAGRLFGIPARGTHAHSWIMAFDDEPAAFAAYAEAMPNNCIFLVDTYDTIEGVKNAVEVGLRLREQGHEMVGIRLDSGDLADLSIRARAILDEAGLGDAAIVASNDLDEHIIASLKQQGAAIGVWGVGTRLVTARDQPALGGVYKLSAIRPPGQPWRRVVKLSEQPIKVSTPGIQQVRRFTESGAAAMDVIFDTELGIPSDGVAVDFMDPTRQRRFSASQPHVDLLRPVFRGGRRVYDVPALEATRALCARELSRLTSGVKRFLNPHQYPVGLEAQLHEIKMRLLQEARSA